MAIFNSFCMFTRGYIGMSDGFWHVPPNRSLKSRSFHAWLQRQKGVQKAASCLRGQRPGSWAFFLIQEIQEISHIITVYIYIYKYINGYIITIIYLYTYHYISKSVYLSIIRSILSYPNLI